MIYCLTRILYVGMIRHDLKENTMKPTTNSACRSEIKPPVEIRNQQETSGEKINLLQISEILEDY